MTASAARTGAAEAVTAADRHPFVARFQRYAEQELRPTALATDRTEVPEATIGRLAELGALTHVAPVS